MLTVGVSSRILPGIHVTLTWIDFNEGRSYCAHCEIFHNELKRVHPRQINGTPFSLTIKNAPYAKVWNEYFGQRVNNRNTVPILFPLFGISKVQISKYKHSSIISQWWSNSLQLDAMVHQRILHLFLFSTQSKLGYCSMGLNMCHGQLSNLIPTRLISRWLINCANLHDLCVSHGARGLTRIEMGY